MQAVRNVTRTRSSDDPDSAHLFSRAETSAIPPSCMPGSNEDSIVWNRPRSLDCRFDLYGIPYFIVGTPVPGISLWISGYDNEFASKNLTKVNSLDAHWCCACADDVRISGISQDLAP